MQNKKIRNPIILDIVITTLSDNKTIMQLKWVRYDDTSYTKIKYFNLCGGAALSITDKQKQIVWHIWLGM